MNSFSVLSLCAGLFSASLPAIAQPVNFINPPELELERLPGKVAIRFPTTQGLKYQVFQGGNFKTWEPVGNVIEGNGATAVVERDLSDAETVFYGVTVTPTATPIPLEIEIDASGGKTVKFPSELGQTYLALSGTDLRDWFVLGDLIPGTGELITIDASSETGASVFFAVESVDVTPLPHMVRIPAGRFRMGSPLDEKDRDLDEDPLTEVVFPTSFWVGKFEVTQYEYERVMGSNPSWFKGDRDRPVEQVSWQDAMLFCAILTDRERTAGRISGSFAYRLPTEAEFEYVCRAGTVTRFSHGDDPDYAQLGQYAWYDGNSGGMSHPVGKKEPNPFGLFDMHGNVWEWCLDWYSSRYAGGTVRAPLGPETGFARVFRGGGWDYLASTCRSAYRNNVNPTRRLNYVGFRLVLAPNVAVPGTGI